MNAHTGQQQRYKVKKETRFNTIIITESQPEREKDEGEKNHILPLQYASTYNVHYYYYDYRNAIKMLFIDGN